MGPTANTISATRLTQRVPWLCVPLSQEVCLFDCYLLQRMLPFGDQVKQFQLILIAS
jgi:hypothetical protein